MNDSILSKKYVIIDTDCGTDDALALMLALKSHQKGFIQILAITCCYGNTTIENVVNNVCLTLQICNANRQEIKIYKGCEFPIINEHERARYHGDEGLGNAAQEFCLEDTTIESEHSANALIKYAKQYPKQITIIALGPLTNLALATLLEPNFSENILEIVSLGGNIAAAGNIRPTAEFNYFSDPEAVQIILSKSKCQITIIPYETCLNHLLKWETYHKMIEKDTQKAKFFEKIMRRIYNLKHENINGILKPLGEGMTVCDILAVIAITDPQLICQTRKFAATIELNGSFTRGQLVVDRRTNQHSSQLSAHTINFITAFNQSKLMQLISETVL